jgi:hypothetical protein
MEYLTVTPWRPQILRNNELFACKSNGTIFMDSELGTTGPDVEQDNLRFLGQREETIREITPYVRVPN